jgi:phage gpG-like protein
VKKVFRMTASPVSPYTKQQALRLFFDRDVVVRHTNAYTRRVLSRFGALCRTIARRSMRRRKGASPPGTPPNAHVGKLRDELYFAYDFKRDSVVVGPVLLTRRSLVPQLHEFGGSVRVQNKVVRYPPRPYMRPAFRETKKILAQILRSVSWRQSN